MMKWYKSSQCHTIGEEEDRGKCVAKNPLHRAANDLQHSTEEDEDRSGDGSVSGPSHSTLKLNGKLHNLQDGSSASTSTSPAH